MMVLNDDDGGSDNKKLRYRKEHSASVVLSWCIW